MNIFKKASFSLPGNKSFHSRSALVSVTKELANIYIILIKSK